MARLRRIARSPAIRRLFGSLLLALAAGAGPALGEAPVGGLERQIKAAYLVKFASFVEWPGASFARPDSALTIGVAGGDALAGQLERMAAGRSVNGHPIHVRRLHSGGNLAGVHMMFLDSSLERSAMAGMLEAARGQSLLTVCDGGDSPAPGCMINFVVAGDKLRFDVALGAVAPSRLRISARMLAVAHKVQAAT